jgi:regulator of sigma E protease
VRLPDTLRSWAATTKGEKKVKLFLLRSVERQSVTLELNWDERWKFDREIPFSTSAPQAIPELGLAYRVGTTVEAVDEKMPDGSLGPAAKAGILRGDVIKAIRFQVPRRSNPLESEPAKWMELDSDEWAQTFWSLQAAEVFKRVTVRVERDGKTDEYELIAVPDDTWPLANRGLNLMPAFVLQKADSVGQAVQLGMQRTFRMIGTIYLSLRAMLTGRVSARKNVGGPIMIAATAYALAGEDLYSFIFFLGLISINLAVINFLPIPILDGGHIVFLVYEKIRGIPASESVRSAATIVGLALILTLFVFTLWLDISRFF